MAFSAFDAFHDLFFLPAKVGIEILHALFQAFIAADLGQPEIVDALHEALEVVQTCTGLLR